MAQAMTRIAIAAAAMLLLAACASPAPQPLPPPPAPPPTPRLAPSAPVARDDCAAREHQYLVGQPRSRIPVPVNPSLQRVACTACPVTQDYNPRRLNFFFEADSGLIREVRCG